MHCTSCGAMTTAGLRYCKHCGEDLERVPRVDYERTRQTAHGWEVEKVDAPGITVRKLAPLFWAIAVFSMVALVVLFGIAVPLTAIGAPRNVIVPLYMFGPAAVVVIAGMLIRQVSRLISLMEKESRASGNSIREFQPAPPQIAAPPATFRSVTEHTTRNFEPRVRRESAGGE